MIKVFGRGSDIVVIEGSDYEFGEIGCCGSNVRISFTDGTVILVKYEKAWFVDVEKYGTAERLLDCFAGEDFCDVFYIDAEVVTHEVIDRR